MRAYEQIYNIKHDRRKVFSLIRKFSVVSKICMCNSLLFIISIERLQNKQTSFYLKLFNKGKGTILHLRVRNFVHSSKINNSNTIYNTINNL